MSDSHCGSIGSFLAVGNQLIISNSVTCADSILFFGFGSAVGGVAADHFSSYNITSRYGSSVLPLYCSLSL
eukprot:SAG22_NODE_195_length_15606_cov_21.340878_7_plen_71_part_00